MHFDLDKLPDWALLIVKKADLLAFAEHLKVNVGAEERISKEEKEILTIEEAASFLNLTKQTIYQRTSNRTIPFYKKNKRLYFKRSELITWLEEGKMKTQEEFDEEMEQHLKNVASRKGGRI